MNCKNCAVSMFDKPLSRINLKAQPGTVKNQLQWRLNTPQLMKEILCNNGVAILHKPLTIFSLMLAEVGDRASELNDPKLNALMCRLAIYEVADPYNENYDAELTNATIEAGR